MTGTVLVVDDEFLIVEVISMMLDDMGLEVCGTAATAQEAVAMADRFRPNLVLMDVRLKGEVDGIAAAEAIHRHHDMPIIFVTGSREPETVRRIEQERGAVVLFKPIRFDQLRAAVLAALG